MDAGEALDDLLDEAHAAELQEFRLWLSRQGPRGVEAVERYDERMRALDLGITRAQACWHSISDAQRRLVAVLGVERRYIERFGDRVFLVRIKAENRTICSWQPRIATVRNLASRDLLEWTGGAFDPEASAAPTERLRFVLRHGPRTDVPNPWTMTPKPVPELPA